MTASVRSRPQLRLPVLTWTPEEWLQRILIGLVVLWLLVGVALPLAPLVTRSLTDADGVFVGLANFARYFSTPGLSWSFGNSLLVALITTVLAVTLAFGYAYALTRTAMPGKGFFRAVAMLPLYAPSLALGIGLVYLFGKKGLVTTGFLGLGERLLGTPVGWDIHLYGPVGIVLGELLYCFPQALVILVVAAGLADARLYEASHALARLGAAHFLDGDAAHPALRPGKRVFRLLSRWPSPTSVWRRWSAATSTFWRPTSTNR